MILSFIESVVIDRLSRATGRSPTTEAIICVI